VLKVNYVIDPKVKGRVYFQIRRAGSTGQRPPLMEVILRLNGIAVVEESSLYRSYPWVTWPGSRPRGFGGILKRLS